MQRPISVVSNQFLKTFVDPGTTEKLGKTIMLLQFKRLASSTHQIRECIELTYLHHFQLCALQ